MKFDGVRFRAKGQERILESSVQKKKKKKSSVLFKPRGRRGCGQDPWAGKAALGLWVPDYRLWGWGKVKIKEVSKRFSYLTGYQSLAIVS